MKLIKFLNFDKAKLKAQSNLHQSNHVFMLFIFFLLKIILAPHSTQEVPLQFMPSSLGQSNHLAKISFSCEQLGDWVFMASGTGLTPTPLDPVSVSATLGSNTSLIIPFRNPLNEAVVVDVILSGKFIYDYNRASQRILFFLLLWPREYWLLLERQHPFFI